MDVGSTTGTLSFMFVTMMADLGVIVHVSLRRGLWYVTLIAPYNTPSQ
jgi:hypothetical protein